MAGRVCRQCLSAPQVALRQMYVPSSEGQLHAVLAGWGVSVLPELKVRAHLKAGTLVDLLPGHHLPVALYWHCWNLNSAVLDALTHARQSAAAVALSPPGLATKPISNKIV